jgi:hypothetical protein
MICARIEIKKGDLEAFEGKSLQFGLQHTPHVYRSSDALGRSSMHGIVL